MRIYNFSLGVVGFLLFMFSGVLHAETMYVKKSGTKLQAEASGKSKVVQKLATGTPVEVLGKSGKFVEVSAEGGKGFIFKFKLSSKAPEGPEGEDVLAKLGMGRDIKAKESTSASSIRGLSPVSEDHAKKKGISPVDIQAVKDMENMRVSPQKVDQFLEGRKLGEYAQ